ncbi:MAG: hypothetical protein GY751_13185 [Bacteroidetes bacterium]|nr:hypothetical protein [Bacteroidota bacterium]
MHFSKSNTKITFLLLTVLALSFASCSTVEVPPSAACPSCKVMERTDLSFTGDMDLQNFDQSIESDKLHDLIKYNFYGSPSDHFDFVINLKNGYELTIKVYDANNNNPWEQVGQPYNIYPGQDLEDKLQYVNVELRMGDDHPAYATNLGNSVPQGIHLDVFKVIRNNGTEIQCRIRDMKLYKNIDPAQTVTINGTFIGAIPY